MNINSMKYYDVLKESLEHELVNFASQVQLWKESGVLKDETFEICKAHAEHIQADIRQMEAEKARFLNGISRLSEYRYQQVITERHIFNKTWTDIANVMKLSPQHIQKRIYPAAIKEFNALIDLEVPELAEEQG